ncbi:CDGSH iron-sulfur domain-containing protein [Streptomyces sp. MST-110588]|uniref:CDGSH iron-sulfur domain-containing protein n=1 Tax=Streptomyces sp. MST-110588 TaxID=2833628 RepID=UPI001F5DE9DC|nr:CDGSH iron-sulfur domain-containing protein [Streptomyces sp. MST-110588]UNO38851.1 CDGSH iron-sulfur domain-containing protein [Streptomyces sp. MST-110588]
MPGARSEPEGTARRVRQEPGGPVLIEGPVEVALEDGGTARSDRPVVAVCMCRRSRIYPWCDTSHRGRRRPRRDTGAAAPARPPEHDDAH